VWVEAFKRVDLPSKENYQMFLNKIPVSRKTGSLGTHWPIMPYNNNEEEER
jgi:hypothetical protein